MEYELTMRDDGGSRETETIEAETLREAIETAKELTEEWVREGDWGNDGASIEAYWTLSQDDEEVESDSITVDIEPDEEALIAAAGGDNDCDHDWTSEGEGGCDQNPGVWATGGTSMLFKSHCRTCGLRRSEHTTGSQRNPGEHDTVEFEQPDSWCVECQKEECAC